jgi:uncharacterized protein (DUF2147 family)
MCRIPIDATQFRAFVAELIGALTTTARIEPSDVDIVRARLERYGKTFVIVSLLGFVVCVTKPTNKKQKSR